jgi:hypothetical protein
VNIKSIDFRKVNQGTFLAEARVEFDDMQITGFKVLKDDKGELWVGAPSKSYQKKDGTTGYQALVWFPDPAKRVAFQDRIVTAYEKFIKKEEVSTDGI